MVPGRIGAGGVVWESWFLDSELAQIGCAGEEKQRFEMRAWGVPALKRQVGRAACRLKVEQKNQEGGEEVGGRAQMPKEGCGW